MERFLTTPLEEREKADQTKSLNTRLASNQSEISKLEKELADAIAERDAEVSRKVTKIIRTLIPSVSDRVAHLTSVLHCHDRKMYLTVGESKRKIVERKIKTIIGKIIEKNFTFHVSEIKIQ